MEPALDTRRSQLCRRRVARSGSPTPSVAQTSRDQVRVLVIAPSPDAIGGQAVQARRLIGVLQKDATLTVAFQAIGPKPPAPFGFMTKIKGLNW